MFYLRSGYHAGCRLPKQSIPFLRERLVYPVAHGCGYQLAQVSQRQPNSTQFFYDMDHRFGFGIKLIAMDHHYTVQLFKVSLKPGRHACSGMALQRGKSKLIGLIMCYHIVDIAVAKIANAIKQNNIFTVA